MHDPHAAPAPHPRPLAAAVTRPLARGSVAPAQSRPSGRAQPSSPERLASLPAPARRWLRRSGWLALLTIVVLLPVAQWGSSKDDLFATATAAQSAWRYDSALADYARIEQLDPADPRPHCLQAHVFALQERYAQAQAAYAACEQLGERTASTWLAQGDAALNGGDVAAAEREWLLAASSGSPSAHRRLALLYEREGHLTDAVEQWQALGTSDAQAEEHLGLLALSAGDDELARADLVAARNLPDGDGLQAADERFVALAALDQHDAAGLAAVGGAFVRADMLSLSIQPLQSALALDPTNGSAHGDLAWVLLAAGQYVAAKAESASAVRLAPQDSFAWFVAAELAMSDARWTNAVTDLQTGLAVDPANPVLWAALGRAYQGQHDYLRTELSLVSAAQLGAEPEFTVQLLQFYVAHGIGVALGQGVHAADTALARFPTNAQVVQLAGEVYEMSRAVDKAYATYQQANTLDPSLPDPYFYVGRMALRAEDFDLAILDLNIYLALRPDGDLAAQARTLLRPFADVNVK